MAIAKPASPAATVVTGLLIKPPYTVEVKTPVFPAAAMPTEYEGIDYTIYLDGTREEDYDPTTQTSASPQNLAGIHVHLPSVYNGGTSGSAFDVRLQVREYYTGSGTYEAIIASNFKLTEQHDIKLDFSGCMLRMSVDGTTYLDTNMFKPALPLYRINFEGIAYQAGSQVALPTDWDRPWEINVIQGIDISAIFEEVIPVIISFAAGMAVMGLLIRAFGSATAALGRA